MNQILFLSPMDSISAIAPEVADELGLSITVETSDDLNAQKVIKSHPEAEIVVSRGGLADLARQIPGISVVEIVMSLNELLSQLSSLTREGYTRIAIVSRANLFSGAIGDFEILGTRIRIQPEHSEPAIQTRVRQMVRNGWEAIIGCRVAYDTAHGLGARAVILESGRIPIRSALLEATRILEAKRREKLQSAQLKAIIDNIDEAVIAVTPDKEISFFNSNARRLFSTGSPCAAPDFSRALAVIDPVEKEQVTTVNGNSVVARSIPLEFDKTIQGRVLTLQEVTHIQASESKIRSSLHEKRLFARYHFSDLIGHSKLMQQTVARAKSYARNDSNVLIHGETGTGKEVFAQSMHNDSRRKNAPFVSVNIASIAPSLIESELFGYVDGAFTGARKGGKPGLFELAHGGTLFLDEIGELAPEMQSRFLRVLQEKEIMRIGDNRIIPVDVRIISATNRDLFKQALSGSFRQDLYYRIHVFNLRIPALRDRAEDVPRIFDFYLKQFSAQSGRSVVLTAAAERWLKSYGWPGNVRQLRNIAEVAAYGENDVVDVPEISEAIGEQMPNASEAGFIVIPDTGTLKEIESEVIRGLMARQATNEVCARLGISRATLWRKLRRPASG
ncbi:MAG: sigma 54-interacting transcriptional regulator [Candidatus Accumulibacter sp.]|nr:sigma 54-interacting transcriptional regulator [Accumulibacter sp.]